MKRMGFHCRCIGDQSRRNILPHECRNTQNTSKSAKNSKISLEKLGKVILFKKEKGFSDAVLL